MQIQITFRRTESSETLKDYVSEKVRKLKKYLDDPIDVFITFTVEKYRHEVEIVIMNGGVKIHGYDSAGDFLSAIDLIIDKLEKQVKKYCEKLRILKRSNYTEKDTTFKIGIMEAESIIQDRVHIISDKKHIAKQINVDEAAMQLDLSDDIFLFFVNAKTKRYNVIYKRRDGNFGLIEPQ